MISKVVEWFADLFGSIWSAIVSAFKWLVETIYNAFIDFVEAIFARMVDLFIFVLSFAISSGVSGWLTKPISEMTDKDSFRFEG